MSGTLNNLSLTKVNKFCGESFTSCGVPIDSIPSNYPFGVPIMAREWPSFGNFGCRPKRSRSTKVREFRASTSFGRDRITGDDVTAKIASSRDENWRNRDKRVSLVRIKSQRRKGIQIAFVADIIQPKMPIAKRFSYVPVSRSQNVTR